MKHLKTIFACLLMAVLSIGQVWAAVSGSIASSIAADDQVVLINTGGTAEFTGVNGSNVGTQAAYSTSTPAGTCILTVEAGKYGDGTFSFKMSDGKYLAYTTTATSSNNKLWAVTLASTPTDDAKKQVSWNISFNSSNEVTINNVYNTGRNLRFNSDRFCCYTSAQTAVKFFKVDTSNPTLTLAPASASVDATSVANQSITLTPDNFGSTINSVTTGLYSDAECNTAITSGEWVKDVTVNAGKTAVTFNVDDNDGAQRQCWLKITVSDGTSNASAILPITQAKYSAPTGTFELFSGDLEEGDYVFVVNGIAMTNTVSSNRLANTDVTVSGDNKITNPEESIIWHVAASGDYWTIYNEAISKYAASTGAANKATVTDTEDDKILWSVVESSGTYHFNNKYNSELSTPVNSKLQRNSTYGWACYAAYSDIQLYKLNDGTSKQAAGLAFDAVQKLAKVGGTLTAPNLSTADGFDGTVTYASSDEAVVKVNASTGAITEIVAAGKAVITAHSDETENFKEGSASYTIFVAEQAGTAEDPLTEASAKALIDLGCEMEVHVHGTVLGSQDATKFTVTLAGGMQFYKLKDLGNVAFESAYIKNGDEVTAIGTLTKYNTTYELAEGCYLTAYTEYTEPLVDISNTKETAYTVAQALGLATNPTSDLTKAVYIAGVVYDVKSFNSTNGTLDIYIKDEGVENKFEFYKCAGIYDESLTAFTAADDVQVGDEVIGYGVMKYFSGGSIWEFDNTATGDYLVELTRPEVAVTGVTVESTASVAVGGHVTLHAAVVPENASNKTINWSIESGNAYVTLADGVVTGVAEGTAVIRATSDADATKYAECTVTVAPLSPWASVYTSNVTLSTEGGTSASAAKVKFYGEEGDGYDALKAGTSGTAGAVVVNVPAGATALHFHAYSWYNETVELTVSAPTGVTVTPSAAISINQNSGISNNSPFTLEDGSTPQYDAYYAVSLSGNTEPIDLTITATEGKRFVLFGVNQEGGLVLESISITGTATALEYTDGQHFDPTGLSVTGHYSDASTAPITEDIVWAFDPDPLTEGTTSVSVTATAAGFTSAAFVVDGLTVAGAAPLSPWATTWTSNLDDITGSKVKFYGEETEYAALKAGSSGTAGSATLNIPAQATELHLHAYGWNSEDVTLSITAPAGVTVTPASITLNRNSGFASNSPFTLAEGSTPQTDAYYALSLSGNTDAIELTITATEGKRFLLFGVNQEGGQLPVLESIEIKGDLTTKTGYKAGDALNLDGLTVEATYSIGGVAQTPVDITDKLGDGLTLTYDPLVENQTEVTITATYGDKSDDITITGLDPVASADPKIYVSTLNVDFGSVEVGEAVPANETVTVTLTNVASVTATLGGTNADAFSVSPASLTESGDITVSVVASTASAANYSATLTISDDATENPAESKVINLSFAVIEPVVTEEYQLVSDVTSLAAGDQIIIVAENAGDYYTLDGSISSQYFPSTAVSISAGIITAPSTSAIILGKDEDNWTMSMGGQLIGATAAKKASLGNNDASNTWTIAIAENVATITNTTTTYGSLQFNYNNGSNSRFLNYTSTQTAVAIYKKVAPEPEYETVRSGLEINRYYTVCLPKKVTAIKGASFWTLHNKSQDGATAYLEEETNNLPFAAGTPFIIQATAANLDVVYEGAATEDAGTNGALHGTLVYMDAAALAAAGSDIYMLFSNELRPVGDDNHLDANRAYVLLSELNPVAEAPQSAPGKRVRAMPMQPQTATGIEDLNASEKPMKMMINGQIFILRGEKMYDTTGRLVK